MRKPLLLVTLGTLLLGLASTALAETREFTVVNVEYEGTKI